MRTLMLAGAAALTLAAIPSALGAQAATAQPAPQTADQANARQQPLPTTTTTVPATTPDKPDTVVTNHPGNLTPPPPQALNKTYPVCTRTLQDSCQNPGEGGASRRGRG